LKFRKQNHRQGSTVLTPLWNVAVETAERTVTAWKRLEPAELLPEEMHAAIKKQILRVADSIAG
jgi:hypothetical protein